MTDEADDLLALAIASACGIVGENAVVRSVSVVGGRRLTAAELVRAHERADACSARLTMDGAGVVTLRSRTPQATAAGPRALEPARGLLVLPRLILR